MDTIITVSLILSSFILTFYFFLRRQAKGSIALNLPPGPPTLPLIGNIHQLAGALPHRAFGDLAGKHGPIMHVKLGQTSAIIISSPRLAKEVLKTHDITLADRPKTLASEIVLYGNSDVALSPYGDYWRQMKKICSLQLLSAKKVRSLGPIREQEFKRFMEFIQLSGEEPINIHQKVTEMVNNVVCTSAFGSNCRQQHQLIEFMDEIARATSGFYLADMFPKFEFLSVITGQKSKLMKLRKTFDEIFDDILEERRERKREGDAQEEYESLLEVLLRIKEEGGLQFPITNNNIKAIFADIFAAGTDTSTTTIEWAMTEMMRTPSVMEKAQAEAREAFKGKPAIIEGDLEGLNYLRSVIKETLRLHPPLPLLLPHECREQCKIDGYDIPIKQKVIISAWACGTGPEYWEDAESFKPESFEKTSVDFMGNDYELIPFGAGRRICPGITFSLRTIEFFLAHMVYYYDWRLPRGLNSMNIDMTETEGVLAAKKDHLHLIPAFHSQK